MSRKYFVEGLFPCNHTSIICGPSGAGKSRWLLPTIADWLEGQPVLGRKSYPMRCGYLSCDRPSDDAHELIEDMQLGERLKSMKIVSLMDGTNDFDYNKITTHFPPGSVDVIVIEAFQALMPNGDIIDYCKVLDFFRKWHQFCQRYNYSILGSVHPPKQREGEKYTLQRDQIMGSGAWGAVIHGLLSLTFQDPANVDNTARRLIVSPRKQRPEQFILDFDTRGYLVPCDQEAEMAVLMLDQFVRKCKPGDDVTTLDVKQWAMQMKISERSMYRWLEQTPLLEKVKRGLYKVRFTT